MCVFKYILEFYGMLSTFSNEKSIRENSEHSPKLKIFHKEK